MWWFGGLFVATIWRFGGCVCSWILGVLWDSGGSLGAPSELVLEWVGVFVLCDVSR